MYNAQDLSVWQSRWRAYNGKKGPGSQDGWMNRLRSLIESKTFNRKETVTLFLDCLQAFGKRQFEFFHDGFGDQAHFLLEHSDDYPVDYTFRATLAQIGYDLEVIEEAAAQRILSDETSKNTLVIADRLAQNAIDMAAKAGLLDDTAVLSYFRKSANIRVIPYVPLAVIAIPDSATHQERDFLATPHEVGHYVYRNAMLDGKSMEARIYQEIRHEPTWLQPWAEEIFADIYGCLVAGPVAALSFQDLLLTHSLAEFLEDDGDHPVELVRPYLYTRVLQALGFEKSSTELNKRWRNWLSRRGDPQAFTPKGETNHISKDEARQCLENVTDKILTLLASIVEARRDHPNLCWTTDLNGSEESAQLYEQFKPQSITTKPTELTESPVGSNQVGVSVNGSAPANTRHKGETGLYLDMVTTQTNSKVKFPVAEWSKVLIANGWTVKGPDGGWPP